jgi:hypothetical protein
LTNLEEFPASVLTSAKENAIRYSTFDEPTRQTLAKMPKKFLTGVSRYGSFSNSTG